MRSRRSFLASSATALSLLAAVTLGACGDDGPTLPAATSGAYEATRFIVTEGGADVDVLAAGGYLDIVLTPRGVTAGTLFLPDVISGEGNVEFDLAGTWTQRGNTVTFRNSVDTFVRDMPFVVQGTTALVGDATFDGTRVRLTLTKIP